MTHPTAALAALLAAALPCAAGAQTISATVSPARVQAGQSAVLAFTVSYANANPVRLHQVSLQLPYFLTVSGASAAGWTATRSGQNVTFDAPCTAPGVAPGGRATFQVTVTASASDWGDPTQDTIVSARSPYLNASLCEGDWSNAVYYVSANVPTGIQALALSGVAAPAGLLGPGLSSAITWTVRNASTSTAQAVTLARTPGGTSGAGWAGTTCDDRLGTLAGGASTSVTCSYTFSAPGTYTFTAAAATDAGWSTPAASVTLQVGTVGAAWDHPAVVIGRPSTLTLTNGSRATIGRVELQNAFPGGLRIAAASAASPAGSSLAWDAASSSGAAAVFTGTLAPGAAASLSITYDRSSLDTRGASTFAARLTPIDGASWTSTIAIPSTTLVVPLSGVHGLSVLSGAAGQRLDWTNVSDHGSTHDGVVVFRTPAGTAPPLPVDFRRYTAGADAGVVYADGGGSTVTAYAEAGAGAHEYRVCSHDGLHVYSDCDEGFWNGQGWLDSAVPPAGGWTRQLGLNATDLIGILPGTRAVVASNQPSLTVLELATGARTAPPVPLSAMPSVNTAGTQLVDGRVLAFGADQAGRVVGVDVATGDLAWTVTAAGASFTAGITGITRAHAHEDLQAAYEMDVLLLGSAAGAGDLLALDARGPRPERPDAVLWRLSAGAPITALPLYDPAVNLLFVATAGGVLAYDLGTSSPGTPPRAVTGWTNPGGDHSLGCFRTSNAAYIACVDRAGILRVLAKADGAVRAQLSTGVADPAPASLARMSAGTPGFVVGSARRIVRVAADAGFATLRLAGTYAPAGLSLSPVLGFSSSGHVIVPASDQRLHKLSSEDLTELGSSAPVASRDPAALLGAASWDGVNRRYVFGTSEGRVWSVPAF